MGAACEYYEQCPSASGWCVGMGPDARCIPFLQSAIKRITAEKEAMTNIAEALPNEVARTRRRTRTTD